MKNSVLSFLVFSIFSLLSFGQQKEFKVEIIGTGAPVLLFPGFSCTSEVWEETVSNLKDQYECHIFTFAGFGDVPPIETPWLPKIKEAVENYVVEKNLNEPTIVGHSLGGTLGLWLASDQPNFYKKLIVVDGLPSVGALMIPNFKSEDISYDNPYSKQQLAMDDVSFRAMASQYASFMSLNKEKHQQLTDWMVAADRKTYVHGYTDLLKLDLRNAIAKIQIPVIVLAATYPNKEMVKSNYEKQFAKLPSAKIFYADDSAHFIMFDQPSWFLEQLNQSLK
ncbi:alpha/beta fold hydrolase [Sungkyunkwania multivorans]|uniref:Alpha/beta fold hydrolase n=1 Tax=Sungkyunkwania multivorans TaxID=1173618 RepID=A0ABW3CUV6_9FLAO